jgi:PHD/YefM family antitoxin component YafN of YafNO toxin-antitoxin module
MATVDLADIHDLSEIMLRITSGESLVIRNAGKDVGVLVSSSDSELLEVIEDYLDNAAADKAVADSDERISYASLRRELGLS